MARACLRAASPGSAEKNVTSSLPGWISLRFAKGFPATTSRRSFVDAENRVGLEAEFFVDGGFEIFAELVEIALVGFEDDVAALHVGLRIAEFQRCAEFLEIVHFDAVVRAEIYAAQHADDDIHDGDDTRNLRSRVALRLEIEIRRRRRAL